MKALIIVLVVAGVLAFIAGRLERLSRKKKKPAPTTHHHQTVAPARPEGCCGLHAVCERATMSGKERAATVTYFSDEELDSYSGREAHEYTEKEIEEFREVLYTLLPEEVSDWIHSLRSRGIVLPKQLNAEVAKLLNNYREMEKNLF